MVISKEEKTREDLFESIIGAVVIDSKWNYKEIEKVIVKMLNLDYFLSNIQSFLGEKTNCFNKAYKIIKKGKTL